MSLQARSLVDALRMNNERAVELMRQERTVVVGASDYDAEGWKRLVDSGTIVLGAPVVYDADTEMATIIYREGGK